MAQTRSSPCWEVQEKMARWIALRPWWQRQRQRRSQHRLRGRCRRTPKPAPAGSAALPWPAHAPSRPCAWLPTSMKSMECISLNTAMQSNSHASAQADDSGHQDSGLSSRHLCSTALGSHLLLHLLCGACSAHVKRCHVLGTLGLELHAKRRNNMSDRRDWWMSHVQRLVSEEPSSAGWSKRKANPKHEEAVPLLALWQSFQAAP